MLETTVILLRLIQYGGAMIFFGSPLFFLYALPIDGPGSASGMSWPRRLVAAAVIALLFASVLGLVAQTAVMAGSLAAGLEPSALGSVIGEMGLGRASLVRATAAALALGALLALKPGRPLWTLLSALGGAACASLAWMGHGAATEGDAALIHLASDVVHVLAAAVWFGALAAFLGLLLAKRPSADTTQALHQALHGFSGIGTGLVAVLLASGLINSWFLVGPTRLAGLWTTPYGQLLSAKLVIFVAMLGLAVVNRYRLTPRLGRALDGADAPLEALAALRASVLFETTAALAILALAAWLGTLAPISAQ